MRSTRALPILGLLALAACGQAGGGTFSPSAAQGDPNLLMPSGATWAVTAIDGRPITNQPKLKREGGRMTGTDGCSEIQTGFATQGLALSLNGVQRGAATCANPSTDAVLAALQTTDGVSAVTDGSLRLTSGGQPRLTLWRVFLPRPGGPAVIDATTDAPPVAPR